MSIYFPVEKSCKNQTPSVCIKSSYELLQTISSITGISLMIISKDGEEISPAAGVNKLCNYLYETKSLKSACKECVNFHLDLFDKAKSTGKLEIAQCKFGLKSFVLPVKSQSGDVLFYVLGGHFLPKHASGIPAGAESELELSKDELEDIYNSFPVIDEDRFTAIISKLSGSAEIYLKESCAGDQEINVYGLINFIAGIAQKLNGEANLKEILKSIVEKITDTFSVDKCIIVMLDESGQYVKISASNDEYSDEIFGGRLESGKTVSSIVAKTGKVLYSYDAQNDPALADTNIKKLQAKSVLSLPLSIGGRIIGLMHLISYKSKKLFSEKDIDFTRSLASELSLVIETAKLFNESNKRADEVARSRDEIKSYFTRIGTALSTSLDLEQLLKLIAELSVYLTRSDAGSIYLIDNKKLTRDVAVIFRDEKEKKELGSSGNLQEYTGEKYMDNLFKSGKYNSYLGIPLSSKGEIKGVLNIFDKKPREYTPGEVELLSFFTGHAAMAIDNARLFASEQKKAREVKSLYDAAKAIGESMNLEDVLNQSVEQLTQLIGIDRCLIFLLDYKNLELYTAADYGLSEEQKDFFSIYKLPIDEIANDLWEMLVQGKSVILPSTDCNCPTIDRILKVFPSSSCLLVPLLTKEQLIGVIYLDDSRIAHMFSDAQVRLVMTLAIQIAAAIHRASLVDQLKDNLDQLKALHQVSTAVTGTLSLPRVFDLMVDKASHLIEAPAVSMLAWNDSTKEYELQASRGLSGDMEAAELHREISERTAKRRRYITYYVSAGSEEDDENIRDILKSASMGGYLSVPLIARKQVVGVLNCFCKEGDKFDSQEIRLLLSFANQAAIAVENARLYAIIKNKVRELATVFEVGKSISSTLDLNEVLEEITSSVVKVMVGDAASIMLLDEEHQDLRIIKTLGLGSSHNAQVIKVGAGTAGIAAKIGRPMVLHDDPEASSPYKFPTIVKHDGMKTILSVPMKVRDKVIGLINLYKKEVYHFSPMEINLLTTLANQAAIAIENARLYDEQYRIAQIIRRHLMPNRNMSFPNIDVGYIYIPSEILSGDYFEVINLGEKRYGLVISDVAGKGTEAAIYNSRAKYIMRSYAVADYSPADTLTLLNQLMEEEAEHDKFISLFYIDLDIESMNLTYSSAGHEPVIFWDNSKKEVKLLQDPNLPIAIFPDTIYNEKQVGIGPGDIIVMYTDGITEGRSPEGEFFGTDRLVQIIQENYHLSAQALANRIFTSTQKFTRRKFTDDFSLLVVKI